MIPWSHLFLRRCLIGCSLLAAIIWGGQNWMRRDQPEALPASANLTTDPSAVASGTRIPPVELVRQGARIPIELYLELTLYSPTRRAKALEALKSDWDLNDAGIVIEAARFTPGAETQAALFTLLERMTGQNYDRDIDRWYRWIWNQDLDLHPRYADFKRALYSRIDHRFAEYFSSDRPSTVRMDEIRWGGVRRDGIPPLKNPETIPASQAAFLADTDVVFGVSFGGQSRAYPKRILAWHEMVKDVVGGMSINGVYCTLCGSMIVYQTEFQGKHYELGTSGFLYRSNKMMYDHDTKSMWSTLDGTPIVGPLVGKGIRMKPLYVVTTTWGKWKQLHPDTDVLSLNTGYRRDYGEGVAYHDYFADDELMFTVPKTDSRLKNKDEVLIVRSQDESPLAIAADFLFRNRIFHDRVQQTDVVVLTDQSGANRVYQTGGLRFTHWQDPQTIVAADQSTWKVTEDGLVSTTHSTNRLPRHPAHRAFWFGWYAVHPNTRLIH